MDINNLRPDAPPAHRIDSVGPVREDRRPPESGVEHQPDGQTGDTVEISQEARARAADAGPVADIPSGTLPAERIAELRHRIVERVHDSDLMADHVMRRIVHSGDLD